ncbi:hypothetical protein G6O69_10965 [Pseudenhygromyxa sp. WMMC2535]|uniref:hypothetical protein n=1 Tax=Pseudenhygromyxa sp. WMMC2535 TaxID=2712867 RepID=UPI001557173A|nr:hypothetical protein [Pseudenhygromyxa sp. WMMC2535]NVB38351.1 hypothetical protein [Pseudenhygromyxa sp. WMMC2535]
MLLTATITDEEFIEFARGLLPVRVDLSDDGSASRYLEIAVLQDMHLIEGVGLSVTAPIEIHWPDRQLLTRFRVERFGLRLEPHLVPSPAGMALKVDLRCGDIDLRWIPKAIDGLLAKEIDSRVRAMELGFTWDFSETLSFHLDEASGRSTVAGFDFDVSSAKLVVGARALELLVPMKMGISRRGVGPQALPASASELPPELTTNEPVPAAANEPVPATAEPAPAPKPVAEPKPRPAPSTPIPAAANEAAAKPAPATAPTELSVSPTSKPDSKPTPRPTPAPTPR